MGRKRAKRSSATSRFPPREVKTVAQWQAFWDEGGLFMTKAAVDRVSASLRKVGLPEG